MDGKEHPIKARIDVAPECVKITLFSDENPDAGCFELDIPFDKFIEAADRVYAYLDERAEKE